MIKSNEYGSLNDDRQAKKTYNNVLRCLSAMCFTILLYVIDSVTCPRSSHFWQRKTFSSAGVCSIALTLGLEAPAFLRTISEVLLLFAYATLLLRSHTLSFSRWVGSGLMLNLPTFRWISLNGCTSSTRQTYQHHLPLLLRLDCRIRVRHSSSP
jgi:hypothetical protein